MTPTTTTMTTTKKATRHRPPDPRAPRASPCPLPHLSDLPLPALLCSPGYTPAAARLHPQVRLPPSPQWGELGAGDGPQRSLRRLPHPRHPSDTCQSPVAYSTRRDTGRFYDTTTARPEKGARILRAKSAGKTSQASDPSRSSHPCVRHGISYRYTTACVDATFMYASTSRCCQASKPFRLSSRNSESGVRQSRNGGSRTSSAAASRILIPNVPCMLARNGPRAETRERVGVVVGFQTFGVDDEGQRCVCFFFHFQQPSSPRFGL